MEISQKTNQINIKTALIKQISFLYFLFLGILLPNTRFGFCLTVNMKHQQYALIRKCCRRDYGALYPRTCHTKWVTLTKLLRGLFTACEYSFVLFVIKFLLDEDGKGCDDAFPVLGENGHGAKHSLLAPLTALANHFFLICRWGETQPLGTVAIIVPHALFVHRKYIWIALGSKPGIYGEKLV
jgi:hypothetical protein